MSTSVAACLCSVEKACIRVSTQNHVTCSIDDAIVWVGGNIIQ